MKKTHEQFVRQIKAMYGDEYEILSKYTGSHEHVLVRHNCGYEYKVTPTNLLSGKHCPKCAGVKKYTIDDVAKIMDSKNLTLVSSTYRDANSAIDYICNKHMDAGVQSATLSSIRTGCTCRLCKRDNIHDITAKKIPFNELSSIYKNKGLILLEPYYNAKTPLRCKCSIHQNHEVFVSPNNLAYRKTVGCDLCLRENERIAHRTKVEDVVPLIEEAGYTFVDLSYHETGKAIVHYICNKHKDAGILQKSLDKFKSGQGSPYCNQSHGEKKIESYLVSRNIPYKREYTFDDLRGDYSSLLRFDFYLPDGDTLIEYNGVQHYSNNTFFFKSEAEFSRRLRYDSIKREYAKNNGYKFVEIPYTRFDDIEDILDAVFSEVPDP